MKVLVTGGTGFLGRHLVERLALEGDEVWVLARGGKSDAALRGLGVHVVAGDVRQWASLRKAVEGVDVIYHCAGKVEAGGRWLDFLEVNVLGTERLIQASLEHGVRRFIHVSSIGVYPERPDGAVISEDDGYDDNTGRGGYTRSKILADQLAFWYARAQSAPVTVIRPATIYGPGGKNNLVRVGVKKGRFNVIFGDGGSVMPLVYVDNVVDALVLAARRDEAVGRAYNVVDDDRITQREYLERMGAALGRPQSTTYLPLPAVRLLAGGADAAKAALRGRKRSPQGMFSRISRSLQSAQYDTARAKAELGWKPRVDFEEAVRRVRKGGAIIKTFRGTLVAFASLAVVLVLIGGSRVPAAAQVAPRPVLIVTVSGSPEPAASAGSVIYAIAVKNDGTTKALNVVVTVPMPAGTALVKCTMVLIVGSPSIPCAPTPSLANGIVTVNLGKIKAHLDPRINLTLTMPSVSVVSTVKVDVDANGDDVDDGKGHTATTVLPPGSFVTYLPSERVAPIACGDTLTPGSFDTDTTAKLSGPLGCTSGAWGLKITASGKTLDLNKFNIFRDPGFITAGSVGILVSNAGGVTITGGGTNTGSGIELFDYCVKDEGPAKKLTINTLRCFKARSAGIDIASKKVTITGVKVDRVAGTATTSAESPGGVGIRTRADKAFIKNSRVLKAASVGIWVSGLDGDGNGVVAQIDDSSIEDSPATGLLLEQGPHSVRFTDVTGDGLPVTDVIKPKDGVVVGPTGIGNRLNGVIVKEHGGNGFVINGTGTSVTTCEVEGVGLDGYVVAGSGSALSGNTATQARHGFIVTGPTTCDPGVVCNLLDTNEAFNLDGDGYVVTGAGTSLVNNDAHSNEDGVGFRIGTDAGAYETNIAENNAAGFVITGSNNTFVNNNKAKSNDGVGFNVSGSGNLFNTNAAETNAAGFLITGNGNTFKSNNKAQSNHGVGFDVRGTGNLFNTNAATSNSGKEWIVGQGNIDEGSNSASGSQFTFSLAGGSSSN